MRFSYPNRILFSSMVMLAALVLIAVARWLPDIEREVQVMDVMFVLDITDSMNVKDVEIDGKAVSRLQWAKDYARRSLLALPCGAHAGLAIFSESRSLILINPVEVCRNYNDLSQMLTQIGGTMAWARSSEVSKAAFTVIKQAQRMQPKPSIVFLTDGHEAPPLHETLYPKFRGTPGEIKGVFVGIGGEDLRPIPKTDESGEINGFWAVDDVLQTDVYSSSRGDMTELNAQKPKTEHLSSQKKSHLEELAAMVGFQFLSSPTRPEQLIDAIKSDAETREQIVDYDYSPWLVLVALVFMALLYLPYAMVMKTE